MNSVRTLLVTFVAIAIAGTLALLSPGCADTAQLNATRAQAQTWRDSAKSDLASADQQIKDLDIAGVAPDDPRRNDAKSLTNHARSSLTRAEAALKQIDLIEQQVNNQGDPIPNEIKDLGTLIGGPAGLPVILGGAAILAVLRAGKMKSALISVAKGIETAMEEDESFRAQFQKHANTFRATQTPLAKRVVDQVTTDGFALSLPI